MHRITLGRVAVSVLVLGAIVGTSAATSAVVAPPRAKALARTAAPVPATARLMAFGGRRDDARRNVVTARIYFADDPAPEGLSSRHRIVVENATYAVMGVINPNTMDRLFQVDTEMIRS